MAKKKPVLKTAIVCTRCSATADLSKNPNAWDGWQVMPVAICPDCIEQGIRAKEEREAAEKAARGGAVVVIERSYQLGRTISTFTVMEAR